MSGTRASRRLSKSASIRTLHDGGASSESPSSAKPSNNDWSHLSSQAVLSVVGRRAWSPIGVIESLLRWAKMLSDEDDEMGVLAMFFNSTQRHKLPSPYILERATTV